MKVVVVVIEVVVYVMPLGCCECRPNTGQYIPPSRRPRKAVKKSLEEKWADDYSPPEWVQNRYIWAAGSILLSGLAWYSTRLN